MAELKQMRLRAVLTYSRRTGQFRWRVRPSNRVHVGDVAGCIGKDGYRYIRVDGRLYAAHRLAWLHVTGSWPEAEVDHRDTDPDNNRWRNLRAATGAQNKQNQQRAHRKNRTTGLLGTSLYRGVRPRASIAVDGKSVHLGYFDTPEQAHAAYVEAKRALHPFNQL